METHADKKQNINSQANAEGAMQKEGLAGTALQAADKRPQAIAQLKLREIANNSPQAIQLREYQDMANNSPQVQHVAQLQATINAHPGPPVSAQNNVVQRKVVDGEKEVDIDAFMKTYMIPQYAKYGAKEEENEALTAHLKSKLADMFGEDEEGDPLPLGFIMPHVLGGTGFFNIQRALSEIRPKDEPKIVSPVSEAQAEPEPVVVAAAPASAAVSEAPQQASASVQVASVPVASPAPLVVAGDPDTLAVGKFELLGGGKYGSTSEVKEDDVDALVRMARLKNVKLTVLTGTHGDEQGWLIGEESFASADTKALSSQGIQVRNVNGLSKGAIKSLIDGASTPAVILAWCFSKVSYENWADIHAIFTKKTEYLELNEKLSDLFDDADKVYESKKKEDIDKYVLIRADIQTTKAAMRALMDW